MFLGFTFSWKRLLGITALRNKFAKSTGIPTTKGGWQRKIGAALIHSLFKLK